MEKRDPKPAPAKVYDAVVAIDYSVEAERALYAGFELIQSRGATLHVLAVAEGEGPPLPHELTDDAKRRFLEEAHATLERYVSERIDGLASAGAVIERDRVRTAVDFGEPGERILALAEALDADLIIIGPRGKTGMERLLMGSVADQVLRQARCSVLVARAREHTTRSSVH